MKISLTVFLSVFLSVQSQFCDIDEENSCMFGGCRYDVLSSSPDQELTKPTYKMGGIQATLENVNGNAQLTLNNVDMQFINVTLKSKRNGVENGFKIPTSANGAYKGLCSLRTLQNISVWNENIANTECSIFRDAMTIPQCEQFKRGIRDKVIPITMTRLYPQADSSRNEQFAFQIVEKGHPVMTWDIFDNSKIYCLKQNLNTCEFTESSATDQTKSSFYLYEVQSSDGNICGEFHLNTNSEILFAQGDTGGIVSFKDIPTLEIVFPNSGMKIPALTWTNPIELSERAVDIIVTYDSETKIVSQCYNANMWNSTMYSHLVIDPIVRVSSSSTPDSSDDQTYLIIIIIFSVIFGSLITYLIFRYVYKVSKTKQHVTDEIKNSEITVGPKMTNFKSRNEMKTFNNF